MPAFAWVVVPATAGAFRNGAEIQTESCFLYIHALERVQSHRGRSLRSGFASTCLEGDWAADVLLFLCVFF